MRLTALLLVLTLTSACAAAPAPEPIQKVQWLPMTQIEKEAVADFNAGKVHEMPLWFTPYNTLRPRIPERYEIFSDRKVYLADDPVGQFLIYFTGADIAAPGTKLVVELLGAKGDKPVVARELSPVETQKVTFLLDTGSLSAGAYRLRAKLVGKGEVVIPEYAFQKSKETHKTVAFPKDGVPLVVHAQNAVPNAEWPISTGVPLPRATTDTADRFVLFEDGKPVAAQFTPRATWYPNGTQLKWMGMDFVARYQDGKPHEYKLTLLPEGKTAPAIATPLKVTETPDTYTVDTGKIRFVVNRKAFAGISQAWIVNADGGVSEPLIKGDAGPYLVEERGERFEAANDEFVKVELTERGPVRVAIYASGWYVSKTSGEKLCQFRTQINAYAGQPTIDVKHRTIITYDTDKQKLADLGFDIKSPEAAKFIFGVDGKPVAGDMPAAQVDPKTKKTVPSTIWVHQDRWDHCRIMGADQKLTEGKQSDGWAALSGKNGAMSVSVRNIWQLYPKELELGRDAMTVHFWPKHGARTYTEQEELARNNLYKFFYCHQGPVLDLRFPQNYYEAARAICGPMMEQQDVNAIAANGQGLAVSNEFSLLLQKEVPAEAAAKQAALYQQSPHAITDPAYTSKTEVEGRFLPVDKQHFPTIELQMDDGYRQNTTTPDILAEYGMWIWPDTHNNWSPVSKLPEWHRIWNNSHYQNVWESWLLYMRSGSPWLLDWARNNTSHFMDVSTVNYDDPTHKLQGHIKGAMYHTKGLIPWGSPRAGEQCGDDYVEIGAHFINPDAFIISYLMMGDPRGYELMNAWGKAFDRAALPPERSRDNDTTLNEMLSYYVTTWDPQALLYINDLFIEMYSRPVIETPGLWTHGFYGKQWVRRYWELTRDERLKEWTLKTWNDGARDAGQYNAAAMLYQWTGDRQYLTSQLRGLSIGWQLYYVNPEDPLNGYGPRLGDLGSACFVQKAPYFLQACLDAGITSIPTDESSAKPLAVVVPIRKDTSTGVYSSWLNIGKTEYGGQKVGYIMVKGAEPVANVELSANVWTNNQYLPEGTSTTYVRIESADGKVLMEGGVLGGAKRASMTATLDPRKDKAPYKIYTCGTDPNIKWTGAATELLVGPLEGVTAAADKK